MAEQEAHERQRVPELVVRPAGHEGLELFDGSQEAFRDAESKQLLLVTLLPDALDVGSCVGMCYN